jgi:hypothetical protein
MSGSQLDDPARAFRVSLDDCFEYLRRVHGRLLEPSYPARALGDYVSSMSGAIPLPATRQAGLCHKGFSVTPDAYRDTRGPEHDVMAALLAYAKGRPHEAKAARNVALFLLLG